MLRAAFAAILVLATVADSRAQSLDAFLIQLRRAVQAGDRAAVAGMIRFPITIGMVGLRVPFKDAAAFLERYDDIFTPALRESIARGSQDVTVEMVDGQLRITGITVPNVPAETGASVAAPVESSRGAAKKEVPRRVSIRVGPRPTQIPGILARGATDVLIVYLPKGRLASVRLERVPVGAAVIRVRHAGTGAPLAARTAADGRFVSGRPADNGEYRIEVRRTDNIDEEHLPYMLSLSLR
jgi:hypothetical protein